MPQQTRAGLQDHLNPALVLVLRLTLVAKQLGGQAQGSAPALEQGMQEAELQEAEATLGHGLLRDAGLRTDHERRAERQGLGTGIRHQASGYPCRQGAGPNTG